MLAILFAMAGGSLLLAAGASAEPCLMVYPTGPAVYHYDSAEYYTVTYGHPLYDPMFDRGGEVLLESGSNEIPYDIYQIPNLIGFEVSMDGSEGYYFMGSTFDLVVDGFSNQPTTYSNILLVFVPDPISCVPIITVDGNPIVGKTYPLGSLVVSTPTAWGNNYSDTITVPFTWSGCYGVRIWAFDDENHNGVKDGGECFTAFSHDLTVPVKEQSWGSIKSLYE